MKLQNENTSNNINNSATVLVIEDDKDMQGLLRAVLADRGYNVLIAADGSRGYGLAIEREPDLILLDLMLPDGDGVDVCNRIFAIKQLEGTPIIVLSVKDDMKSKLRSFLCGSSRYITKPFSIEELVAEVERTLRQKRMSRVLGEYRDAVGAGGDFGVMPEM